MDRSMAKRPRKVQMIRKIIGMALRGIRLEFKIKELGWFTAHPHQSCSDDHSCEHSNASEPNYVGSPLQGYQRRRHIAPLSPVHGRTISAHELLRIWHHRVDQTTEKNKKQSLSAYHF